MRTEQPIWRGAATQMRAGVDLVQPDPRGDGHRVAIVEAGGLLTATTTGQAMEKYFVDQGILGSIDGGGLTLVLAGRALAPGCSFSRPRTSP